MRISNKSCLASTSKLIPRSVQRASAPAFVFSGHARSVGRDTRCFAQWLESGSEISVPVPRAFAYQLFEDRASIPEFMSWIQEVKVTTPDESKWILTQEAFGRTWTLQWLAKNMAPIKYQKIHWRSVPGSTQGMGGIEVQNRGDVRFTKVTDTSCSVKLTVQFEVPEPLVPFGNLLTPIVSDIVSKDMKTFQSYAADKYAEALKEAEAAEK